MLSIRRLWGKYTLARDAILRGAQITYTPKGVITSHSFGLDKKSSNPIGLLDFLEAPLRFELRSRGVADLCLTTWPWRLMNKATSVEDVALLERITGLEPATSTLARLRSTK